MDDVQLGAGAVGQVEAVLRASFDSKDPSVANNFFVGKMLISASVPT
jgi:hypothetical protein